MMEAKVTGTTNKGGEINFVAVINDGNDKTDEQFSAEFFFAMTDWMTNNGDHFTVDFKTAE